MSKRLRCNFAAAVIGGVLLSLMNASLVDAITTDESNPDHDAIEENYSLEDARSFLKTYCMDCHVSGSSSEGAKYFELLLNDEGLAKLEPFDRSETAVGQSFQSEPLDEKSHQRWIRVLEVIEGHEMPPSDAESPSSTESAKMISWVDQQLQSFSTLGGTPPRRLSREEYQATIEAVFGIKDFKLPSGFPVDRPQHGFNNLGEGLILSPTLLEAYAEGARSVADQIFPPPRELPDPSLNIVQPTDLVISYSSAKVVGDALRLGMKCDPIQRSCTWPSRFEAKVTGEYEVTVLLSTFQPADVSEPMVVKIFARDVASADSVSHRSLRLLEEISVTSESPEEFRFDAVLYEGQTIVLHWANAVLDSDRDDKVRLREFFESKHRENPKYLAAWHTMLEGEQGQGFRGGIGWERVKTLLADPDLPEITEQQVEAVLKKIVGNPVLYAETVVFDVFENGPSLEIHRVEVSGPTRLSEGPREQESERLRQRLIGDASTERESIDALLERVFRRPVDKQTLNRWHAIYDQHVSEGFSAEQAMHLVVRNALISPRFLYRCLGGNELDSYDLATRLSYFLTMRPPDEKLLRKVTQLDDQLVLRDEAKRLIPTSPGSSWVKSFTEQWLDTQKLADIMPDRTFKYSRLDQKNAKLEVEHFFAEMLRENRPLRDFVDPDFTYTSPRVAKNVYEVQTVFDKKKANDLLRISLPRGGRFGGVLGFSAVMLATSNGVDTQPVTRGVWVLEKLLGQTVPPPPNAVPPLTPDTRGAQSPRELLAMHTSEGACARCHRRIDPFGLVLESFDPVGRWREAWPEVPGQLDSKVELLDGTVIEDVRGLKEWMLDHLSDFGTSLGKHLMVYATGRPMSYLETKEIERLVQHNLEAEEGFRDLLIDLIASPIFAAK